MRRNESKAMSTSRLERDGQHKLAGDSAKSRALRVRSMILRRALLPPFVVIMLVCATLVYYFTSYSRNEIESGLVRVASDHRRMIDQFLTGRAADLRLAAGLQSREAFSDKARLAELLHRLQSTSEAFFDLGLIDQSGDHVAYVGPYELAEKNYADAEWFRAVRECGLYMSDVFLGYRQIPHFVVAVRGEDEHGPWYLRATIDTAYFTDLVRAIRIGQTGEAYLVNRGGVFQSEPRAGGRQMEKDQDYGVYRIDPDQTPSFSTGRRSGERYLYATAPLEFVDWVLVVRQRTADAYAHLFRAVFVALLVIVTGGMLVVCIAYILASSLAHQLSLADIEKREMRAQLIVAGRLAEVGEMSARLAHEINNPLQVMKSEHAMLNELLKEIETDGSVPKTADLGSLKESLAQLDLQIERCSRITQGLLKFARKQEPAAQRVFLQRLLPESARMVERRAREQNVAIAQQYDPDLPPVMSDPYELQQVFLNLLNNALDALEGKKNGNVRVSVARDGDNHIAASVADDGCGVATEHLDRIFDPFFTTKPVGKGTGLGLSMVCGIVEGLGGRISVTSEPGNGSLFTIRLPIRATEITIPAHTVGA